MNALTDHERAAIAPLSLEWTALPKCWSPNATASLLQERGLIEFKWVASGYLIRLTRAGLHARGDLH